MSSSKRWTSASGTDLAGRGSPLAAALSPPVRQSARRSVSLSSEPAAAKTSPVAAVSLARSLWPSSTGNKSKSKAPRPPSPLSSEQAPPPPPPSSAATTTLGDHLVRDVDDDGPRALSRQRSCTQLPRFADAADAEARKIGKPSGKSGSGHAFGRSMRFLPSTRPAGVTLTPGRVAPSDLRRLANANALDAAADVASSGSECSDASRGSASTPRTASNSNKSLLPRTGSVRLLGSSTTQWALSPGRRSGSPLRTSSSSSSSLATVPDTTSSRAGNKKNLISLGWGHIFHRRKHAAEDASLAAVTANLLSSSSSPALAAPSSSSSSSRGSSAGGGGEAAGHHRVRMAHCRLLQWRFANAKEEAVRKRKTASVEVELLGAWASVAEMRGKVGRKRVQLEKEQQRIRLNTVLASQMRDLERWGQLETGHDSALTSTVACARAAVCRLPLTNGAKVSLAPLATIQQQALELTLTAKAMTRSFSPMAQDAASLVSKLVRVAREEQAMLQECVELLHMVSALQVQEQSLRSHLVQSAPLSAVTVK